MLESLDGLFLDFYGTLVGGDRAIVEAVCQRVVDAFDLPISASALGVEWGKGYFAMADVSNNGHFRTLHAIECESLVTCLQPLVGRAIDPEPFVADLQGWLRRPPVCEETLDVLAEIRRRGIPVCLVSNADHDDLLLALEHTGIRPDHVVSSESARSYKPNAAIFSQAITVTGWSPGRVAHVGDSLHSDIGGAKAFGLPTIWVCRENRISDIGTEKPDYRVSDLRGLLNLLPR
ncbi:MAG: HAD family hydrolase [Phycisphaerae bacterium]|nr:HAD family hydrolase [Phycisphaerae bacterium]